MVSCKKRPSTSSCCDSCRAKHGARLETRVVTRRTRRTTWDSIVEKRIRKLMIS